jgi:hypothetical protein
VEAVVTGIEQGLHVAMGRGNAVAVVVMRIEQDLWVAMDRGKTVAAAAMDALVCRVAVGADWGLGGNVARRGVAVGGEQAREEAGNAAVVMAV